MIRIIAVLLLCLISTVAFAEQDSGDAFLAGVKNFREKKFQEASDSFAEAFKQDPENVAALVNRASAEFSLGRYGLSLALARRAAAIDPENEAANAAVNHLEQQIQAPDIQRDIEFFESIRSELLLPIPLWVAFASMLLLFSAGGYLFIRFLGARKKSFRDDQPPPPFPTVASLFILGWLFFSFVFWAKVYDFNMSRVTVISEKSSVHAGPGDDQLLLFEAPSGVEFILKATQGEWALVKYPGGLSGWTHKKNLYLTSGQNAIWGDSPK